MKGVVVEECEQTLLRKNVGIRLQYYAVIALNQTILTNADQDVAAKLVDLYITIFKQLLHEGGGEDATKPTEGKREKAMKKKKRKCKGSTSVTSNPTIIEGERSKLVTALLTGVNRAFPFAKMDENVASGQSSGKPSALTNALFGLANISYDGHMDTLFKVTHTGTFNLSIQALMLIYQAMSAKQPMYLNLLFKALKADIIPSRVKAFVKRLIQVAAMHQPPFICGSFYMISEVRSGTERRNAAPEDNEDQQEHFVDVDREEMQGADGGTLGNALKTAECPTLTSSSGPAGTKNEYDPLKREPIYSNADRTCLWELVPFAKHYHPAVALFARTLLAGERIAQAPQMEAHTLIHFLERFVYRNAKAREPQRGVSIMQPIRPTPSASRKWAVNTEEWFSQSVDQIPVEEVSTLAHGPVFGFLFFHKYFTTKREQDPNFAKKAKKKKESEGEDGAADDGDLDEDEVWDAMMRSGGLPAGDSDEDASDGEGDNLGPMSSDEEEA
ncbi:MAG: CBF/Mak21 family-domain-containing protein, partial [Olpidium bornovanus]